VTEEPDFEGSLIVEIITYTIYIAWLSTISAVARYFEFPPLPDIERAVGGEWQGTAAAIAAGVLFIAVSQAGYNAIRGRIPTNTEETSPGETVSEEASLEEAVSEEASLEEASLEEAVSEEASGSAPPTRHRSSRRKKKSRKGKKRR
jgi:hypothetical protein